jgi:nucleotide-binding universal stress UspA family protein
MLPIKKILTTTDFSEPSYKALEIAGELALSFSAEVVVVHVVGKIPVLPALPTHATIDVPLYQEKLEEAARAALEGVIEGRFPKKVKATPIIRHGYAAEGILEVAEEQSPDVIVIATHGETGVRHLVFGSVAEKVVRLATAPVLSIRSPE